jgi:hypothetical protein
MRDVASGSPQQLALTRRRIAPSIRRAPSASSSSESGPCRAGCAVGWASTPGGPGGEAMSSHTSVSSAARRAISRPGGAGADQKHPYRPVVAEAVIEPSDAARAVAAATAWRQKRHPVVVEHLGLSPALALEPGPEPRARVATPTRRESWRAGPRAGGRGRLAMGGRGSLRPRLAERVRRLREKLHQTGGEGL